MTPPPTSKRVKTAITGAIKDVPVSGRYRPVDRQAISALPK